MGFLPKSLEEIRNANSLSPSDEYYTKGIDSGNPSLEYVPNVEGFWSFDNEAGFGWMDNTGTILFNASSGKIVRRIFSGPINVKWFNAKGDGVSDDTSAIQLAIQACEKYGYGYGMLYFPTGVYIVDGLIISGSDLVSNLFGKITICGDGENHSIIKYKNFRIATGWHQTSIPQIGKSIFTVKSGYVTFKDIKIEGTILEPDIIYETNNGSDFQYWSVPTRTYLCNGIFADGDAQNAQTNHLFIEKVRFQSCEICVHIVGGVGTKIDKCLFGGYGGNEDIAQTCNFGIKLHNSTLMCPNAITINDSTFNWCKRRALVFANGNLLTISGCIFERNGTILDGYGDSNSGAILIEGNLNIEQDVGIINVEKCWFESNAGYDFFYNNMNNGVIFNLQQNHFIANGNGQNAHFGLRIESANQKINKVNIIGSNFQIPLYGGFQTTFVLITDVINIIGSNLNNTYFSTTPNIIG